MIHSVWQPVALTSLTTKPAKHLRPSVGGRVREIRAACTHTELSAETALILSETLPVVPAQLARHILTEEYMDSPLFTVMDT